MTNSRIFSIFYYELTELEIQLRDYCQKVRVHTQLSGAHIILPCGTSLAIRAYYPHDLERIRVDDLDDLPSFLEHFQCIVVFFIMPFATQQAMMGNRDSFMRRAFDLLDHWQPPKNEQQKNPPRMVMITDTRDAVFYIMQMVDAMQPEKTKLRNEYFLRKQKQQFCLLPQLPDENFIADHIGNAVMEWAKLLDISADDIRLVFMSVKTVGALASMDNDTMANIPVDKSILLRLRNFFTGAEMNDSQVAVANGPFDTNPLSFLEQQREYGINNDQTFPGAIVSPYDPPAYNTMGNGLTGYSTGTNASSSGLMDNAMAVPPSARTPHRYGTPAYSRPPFQELHPPQNQYAPSYMEHMQQVQYDIHAQPQYSYGPPPSRATLLPQPWMQSNGIPYQGGSIPYQHPHGHLNHPPARFQTPSQYPRSSSAPWGSSVSSHRRFANTPYPNGHRTPNTRNGPR